ncbi:MAG TPA: glycosyltransferase family 4 protein [Rubricoccaceae bacterium]|nr:glycosyltransferase family 4 protein [Rubricoccaceae bacterium]
MSKISPAERPRLLFVYQEPTSFVRDDLGLLRERYDVRPFAFGVRAAGGKGARAVALARGAAAQAAWLRRELPSADLVFGWFADYHLALPARAARRAGVPLAVALGGFDCMDLPQLDYGVFRTWRAPLARFVLRNASVLLPVHDSLLETHNLFLDRAQAQGVRVHVPGLATPAVEVPTGYDPAAWPLGPAERAPGVLSVGLIDSHRTFLRKGLDLLVEVARRLPAVPFEVVGLKMGEAEVQRYRPPANVAFRPPLPREALPEVYGRASVYLQLSRAEGMPNVLCEAMLCGCVPVGSSAFGIPAAIGDAGYVVEAPDPAAIADVVREALAAGPAAREAARAHVAARFSRQRRRERLFGLLDGLLAARRP